MNRLKRLLVATSLSLLLALSWLIAFRQESDEQKQKS